jgi:acyl dehydratase
MTRIVHGLDDLRALSGTDLGHSDWMEVTQDRIDTFADATDDHQWIHVDPDRAAEGPFGATIAHGYLTLSLIIPLYKQLLSVHDTKMGVNYGLDKVRFPAPVKVGSKIRMAARLDEVVDVAGDGVELRLDCAIEIEGSDKPAVVARVRLRQYA